jgi:hypothetical protein
MQIECGITAGRPPAHDDNLRLENSHAKTMRNTARGAVYAALSIDLMALKDT